MGRWTFMLLAIATIAACGDDEPEGRKRRLADPDAGSACTLVATRALYPDEWEVRVYGPRGLEWKGEALSPRDAELVGREPLERCERLAAGLPPRR